MIACISKRNLRHLIIFFSIVKFICWFIQNQLTPKKHCHVNLDFNEYFELNNCLIYNEAKINFWIAITVNIV